jgi:hypothetical protein
MAEVRCEVFEGLVTIAARISAETSARRLTKGPEEFREVRVESAEIETLI